MMRCSIAVALETCVSAKAPRGETPIVPIIVGDTALAINRYKSGQVIAPKATLSGGGGGGAPSQ